MPPFKKRSIKKAKKSYRRFLKRQAKKRTTRFIKRVVGKITEKKDVQFTSSVFSMANPQNTADYVNNTLDLTNSAGGTGLVISQGTGQSNRLGNRIRIASAYIRFVMIPHPFDAIFNDSPIPQDVRIVIYKLKGTDTSLTAARAMFSTTGACFQANNSSASLLGTVSDMTRELNTDVLTVYSDRIVKLGASAYDYAGSTTGAYFYGNNNDYKFNIMRRYNLLKHGMPRIWDFNDTSNTPYGYRPLFMSIIPVPATGTSPSGSAFARPLNFQFQLDVKFTDA